ncbi:hypothetical protein KSP39_PZI021492 [Platanthera zijinensis]|uniref:Reverse transcriptase domain-containing protein n=1 Tax=Platanthera zijinensis TaxID=2320716 RepID=A0AAP0AYP5_9ASPA
MSRCLLLFDLIRGMSHLQIPKDISNKQYLKCLLFADDIVLVDETREGVNAKLESWLDTLEKKGFRLSRAKTEYMELKFSSTRWTDGVVFKLGDQDIFRSECFNIPWCVENCEVKVANCAVWELYPRGLCGLDRRIGRSAIRQRLADGLAARAICPRGLRGQDWQLIKTADVLEVAALAVCANRGGGQPDRFVLRQQDVPRWFSIRGVRQGADWTGARQTGMADVLV